MTRICKTYACTYAQGELFKDKATIATVANSGTKFIKILMRFSRLYKHACCLNFYTLSKIYFFTPPQSSDLTNN